MPDKQTYFLSGIGGSGMLPLARILKSLGHDVRGSDRAHDQGMFETKFNFLKNEGITLFPQDGSGLSDDIDMLIISAAVEEDTPDVKAAKQHKVGIKKRADVLAELFNTYENRIAVGGTSGKTTVTGMIGFILERAGKDPMMMNGGNLQNYYALDNLYPSVLLGQSDIFVTEADESDGTIALYNPTIAVLNNLALDHKKPEETAVLFKKFIAEAVHAIVNADAFNEEWCGQPNVTTYGIANKSRFQAQTGADHAKVHDHKLKTSADLELQVPGVHNIYNALAAIAAVSVLGVGVEQSCRILKDFTGIKRRLETIGMSRGVIVVDDFAHNPDKISASLSALKAHGGRLLIMFQPHGFGPLKLMGKEIADSFAQHMSGEDVLYVPDVIYWGGTVNKEVTSKDLVEWVAQKGKQAQWHESREAIKTDMLEQATYGDIIVIMGARDDSLSAFAEEILESLGE